MVQVPTLVLDLLSWGVPSWIASSTQPIHDFSPLNLLANALINSLWSGCALYTLILRQECALANFIFPSMGVSSRYLIPLQDVSLEHPRIILTASFYILSSCMKLSVRTAKRTSSWCSRFAAAVIFITSCYL